ncbi:hypothetical protein [Rhodomicrobium sp. Az07]|uniref:hypothetical protein n=1 Tax=Rhodomicrobium sp. Az07 TaxID=2839034 RepID=UPI00203711F5|nr:hypothetical protein [Rhodomicrobium sp. Az07]
MSGQEAVRLVKPTANEWREKRNGKLSRVSEIGIPSDDIIVVPDLALADADYIFGVDTNQLVVGGQNYSVSCLTCATSAIAPEGFLGSIQSIMAVDFCDTEYQSERIGWVFAIEAILRSGISIDQKVIICTDHDVGSHRDLNDRSQALIERYVLPLNFKIVYARDKGITIPNKLISASHKGANRVGSLIKRNRPSLQYIVSYLLGGSDEKPRLWHSNAYNEYFSAKP